MNADASEKCPARNGDLMTFSQVLDRMKRKALSAGEQPMFTRLTWPANRMVTNDPMNRVIKECWARHGNSQIDEVTEFAPTYEDIMAGDWMEA